MWIYGEFLEKSTGGTLGDSKKWSVKKFFRTKNRNESKNYKKLKTALFNF